MRYLKTFITILLINLFANSLIAQSNQPWYSYYDAHHDLIGYKDAQGHMKIPPRFTQFTQAKVFRNIIAVTEQGNKNSYYLLKNGKHIGKDSLYVWDFTYDCEQEGKIRFRDPKTDKVGFFGTNGKVVVPANYNDARPFYNNIAVVLYKGKRKCMDGSQFDPKHPCEHWYWDGITGLIDDKGNLIADHIDFDKLNTINWYSLKKSNVPADTNLYVSLKAKNGGYYTFLDYQKEFKTWFYDRYLKDQSANNLFNIVCIEGLSKNVTRKFVDNNTFSKTYDKALSRKLQNIMSGKVETQIMSESLNNLIYTQSQFKPYYTENGEDNAARYPLFDVVTNHYNKGKFDYQETLSFLRTANGYKLIAVAWKNLL